MSNEQQKTNVTNEEILLKLSNLEKAIKDKWKEDSISHRFESMMLLGIAIFALAYTWLAVDVNIFIVFIMAVIGLILMGAASLHEGVAIRILKKYTSLITNKLNRKES